MNNGQMSGMVGSDSSYDLIIEIWPLDKNQDKLTLEIYPPELLTKAKEHLASAVNELEMLLKDLHYRLHIKVLNKVPDIFIWIGRIEGACHKVIELVG